MSELSKAGMARLVRAARRGRQYVAAVSVFVAGIALCLVLPWYPRGGIAGILFLTGMLAIHLFRLAARSIETASMAIEVAEANRRLEEEISERKAAEATLWASEIKHKTLYDLSSDAVMLLDPDAGFVSGNRATVALFGCREESDFGARRAPELWSPDYQPDGVPSSTKSREMIAIALRDGAHRFEWRYKRLNGSEFLANVSLARMDIAGKTYLQATVRDITEQRWTERMLQTSEQHYRLLAENISDVIWSIDPSGRYTYVSPTVFQQRGYTSEEAMAETIDQSLTPDSATVAREKIAKFLVAAKHDHPITSERLELEIRRKDGSTFWGELTFNATYDDAGKLLSVQGTTRDITERKRTQTALEESERRLADIIDFLPDATFVIDRGGKVIAWNRAIEKMTGVSAEAMLGKGDYAYAVPFYGEARPILIDLVFTEDAAIEAEYLAIRREGAQLISESYSDRLCGGKGTHLSGVASPLYDSNGRVVGAIESIRDITEQKRAQKALEDSQRRLATIIDFLPDATLAIDPEGHVIAWNRAIEDYTGVPAAEILGKGNYAYAVPLHGKAQPILVDLVMGGHEDRWAHYDSIERKGTHLIAERYLPELRNGAGGFIWAIAAPIYDSEGRVVGAIESFRDITEQKRADDALRANETKYRALFDASMDGIMLRTPDRRVIGANRAAVALFGCKDQEELISTPVAQLYPEHQPDGVLSEQKARDMIEIARRTGSHCFEWSYIRIDGTPFEATVALTMMDVSGKSILLTTIHDITEQKRAAEAVRASETKYRTLYDASSDAILLRTPDRRIVAGNSAAVTLFGCKDESELLALTPEDIYAEYQPDGRPASEKAPLMAEIALRDGSYSFEWKYRRKDGSEFLANVLWTRMELEGKPILLTTIRDITEQRKAEEALRASQTQYKTLFEASSDAIMLLGENGVIRGNRATLAMFGYENESDMLGLTPTAVSPECQPDGSPSAVKADEMMAIAMREGSHAFSWLHKRKDGTEFFADVILIRTELEGKPVLLATERDITAKKLAQEALAASERQLRMFAENVTDVIWRLDLSGRFTYVSPSVKQLLGFAWNEEATLTVADIMTPASLPAAKDTLEKIAAAVQRGERLRDSREFELRRLDGSTVWTEISVAGLYDESGQMVGFVGVTRDTSDRKEVEEERKLATERMESLLALSHMADKPMNEIIAAVVEDAIRMTQSTIGYMAMVNEDETVLTMEYWSKSVSAECMLIDKPIVYPIETVGLWGEAVRQRQPVVTNDYAAPNPLKRGTPEGHLPVIRHMNIPVFDGPRIVAVAGVANKPTDYDERDLRQLQLLMEGWWRIATHKQYELNLAKARDEAQAANRAKSHFLATMSHEIRTPMTAILGYADLLMDPMLSASNRNNYATTIRRSGEHLLALINDILDLSKIEAGRMSLEWGRSSVVSLLADVASLLRPRAEQRGIELSIDYPGPIPETIHTDSARLRQAIINLAGNAIKFTERGSVRIVVSFLRDACAGQPAVRFEVIDTGIGIRQEVISQLFQPFSQGDASITQRFGGTGLGLAISHHIAEMLGGTLTVTSVLGEGSTFVLTVPTGRLEDVPMVESPQEVMQEGIAKTWTPERHDLTGVRVLLAEDGYDNRELIQAVLQRVGASVETAENGRVAVEKAQDDMFDVVLMDMNMPEMDGYEATGKLRDLGYAGPILALTANAMMGDGDRCKVAGCDEYLTKPIDRALLIQTIAESVETRKAAAASADRSVEPPRRSEPPVPLPEAPPGPVRSNVLVSEFIDDPAMAPIIERFVTRLADQLEAMSQTLAARQFEDLRRLAHKLKGAGGSYGYPLLTETSRVLEDAAKMQDGEAAHAAFQRVSEVAHSVQRAFLGTNNQG